MHVFVLVDLHTQAELLPAAVRTWPPERFLSWLQLYGEVFELDTRYGYDPGTRLFGFRAPSGLYTAFTLTEHGRLCVMFPHYRVVWPGTAE